MKTGIIIATIGATLMLTQNALAATAIDCVNCTTASLKNTHCLTYGPECCAPCKFKPIEITCSPTTCFSETLTVGDGCDKVIARECVNNLCISKTTARCKRGYFGNAKINDLKNECTGCTACKSPGTTSGPGATQEEECYIPKGFNFSDTSGNGTYAENCPW